MVERELTSILVQPAGAHSADHPDNLAHQLGVDQKTAEQIVEAARKPRMTILNDQPVSDDSLGFGSLVRTLSAIVLAETTQTPISIGIDGEWGTGKTSTLKMVELQARMLGFPCIWLNAWSLESPENLLMAVASEIRRETLSRSNSQTKISKTIVKWFAAVTANVGTVLVPSAGPAIDMTRSWSDLMAAEDTREKQIEELASLATARASFAQLVEIVLKESNQQPGQRRLLVFVDDIDRALPDQVAIVLKNLKLILEVPGCVFLLGMDMSIVARSIEDYYKGPRSSLSAIAIGDLRSGEVRIGSGQDQFIGEGFGDRYLEKLVQIKVAVPLLSRSKAIAYLRELGIASEIIEIVGWAPDSEILNPRRLKRYINWLAISLQLIMSASERPPVSNVFALRALALRQDYPELYERLIRGEQLHFDTLQPFLARRAASVSIEREESRRFAEYLSDNLDMFRLIRFDEFVCNSPEFGANPTKRSSREVDLFERYEAGVRRLIHLLSELEDAREDYLEVLAMEEYLHDNLMQARQYGDTEIRRTERARLVVLLNEIALKYGGTSFNELMG